MSTPTFDSAQARAQILAAMAKAALAAGRNPSDVALTAVSKQQPWSSIEPVLTAGQSVFGENRVQEAANRWSGNRHGIELRLIGPLQTNKARQALALFDVIETVDRERLARALADATQDSGTSPGLLVQVNTGEEPQKAGVAPQDAPAFIALCREQLRLPVEGLMCIPPADEAPAPHFALLAKLARTEGLRYLSMGMSADFEIAIRLGATHVRVGSAIFGERE